jgi:hypothetical protein
MLNLRLSPPQPLNCQPHVMKIKRGQFSTSLKLYSLHLHERTVRGFAITSTSTRLYYSSRSLKTKRKMFLSSEILTSFSSFCTLDWDNGQYCFWWPLGLNVPRPHVYWCVVYDVSERDSASMFGIVQGENYYEYRNTLFWNMLSYAIAHCIFFIQSYNFKFWHVYVLVPAYFVWPWKSRESYRTFRNVTPGSLSATDTCIVYHVTHFEASGNVILHTHYVSTCVWADCGWGRGTMNKNRHRCR